MVGFLMANMPYLSNFRATGSTHGLDEAPVVHQPAPAHLGEDVRLNGWLSHGQYALPT